jgi:cobalt/nickel transport system permease protein
MHIPDGFLDPKLSGGLLGAAAGVLAYCLQKVVVAITAKVPSQAWATAGKGFGTIQAAGRRVLTQLGEEQLRRMGAVAGWIFAAQMFNFPIASGTSGHLIGGVFAGILLGPFAGTLVISTVLLVQAFFFTDGGMLALGANIINMAVIGSLGGYYLFTWLSKIFRETASAAIAAWFSVVLAALACSLEIGLSGTVGLREVMAAMFNIHGLIGLAEALITMILLRVFPRSRPA